MALFTITAAGSAQTTPAPLDAASPGRSWARVEALRPGKKLRIVTMSRSHIHCVFTSADDTSIHCGQISVPRAEIRSVKILRHGLSAGVGVAAGLLTSAVVELGAFDLGWNSKASTGVVVAVAIVGVGALVAIPILAIVYDWCGETIYKAE